MKNKITTILTTIIVAAATVVAISIFGLPRINGSGGVITKDTTQQVIQERIEDYSKTSNLESDITKAIDQVWPSVVSIIATKDLEFYLEDPVSFFLGKRPSVQPQKQEGINVGGWSGIIVSKDGYVITNKHVVVDTTAQYTVVTNDGSTYNVQHVRLDPMLDVAVLKVVDSGQQTPTDLNPASFVSLTSPVHIGQFVVSMGNALTEYASSASFGIISAKNRTLTDQSDSSYIGLYQIDSTINPGNSGGPLISTNGDIIGMNTAIAQGAGIGFALPLTHEFIQTTLAGSVTGNMIQRPYIGLDATILTKAAARNLNITKFTGLYIQTVQPNSPAAAAWLMSGDVITEINNNTMQADMPLLYTLYAYKPNETISLLIYRNKDYKKIDVVLGALGSK